MGRSPPQGAVLALRVTVAAPRGAEDGFDERGWLARRGVHVVLHGGDWRIVGRRGGLGGVSDRLRAHVARAIAPGLGGERRAVLAGVVLGEDEGLTDELRANFKASGLYHLLAVSGQNVTFLAIGVLGLAWLLGIHRLAAEVAAIGAIAAYVLAVGWQPSVVRAGVAGGLASLAWLLARPRDRWHFLALGAAVLLAWTPACLFEPGFQLSFAAVGAIFLLLPRLRLRSRGIRCRPGSRRARRVDCLWGGDGADPLAAVRERPGLLAAGERARRPRDRAAARPRARRRARRAAAAVGGARPGVGERLDCRLHRGCARMVARLPFAQIGSGKAVCVLLGTPVALLALQRLPRWRRPAAVGCAAIAIPALLVWQLFPSTPLPPPKGLRITFLDVGQGDAILVQVPRAGSSSTKGHPRRTSRSSYAHSASVGWLPLFSPIRSATTSVAPRPCCAGSRSTVCSTRS